MFKNVLVGVDGSSNGRDAIALASQLTDRDGQLTLAHVHAGAMHPLHAVTPHLLEEEREASQRLLERERDEADVDAAILRIIASAPGGGLHRQAEAQGADLLVVGSCARGTFGRAMLGDDTRAALNGASCAVAIAAKGYSEHPTPIAKIGIGYNGSPESRAALARARQLAEPTNATVRALEVVSIPTYAFTGLIPPAIGESLDVVLSEASMHMRELEGAEGSAVYGLTGEELAAFGEGLDILVVGSRSYGPIKRLVVGSTSDYLERHARCSLLILPRTAAASIPEREPETALSAGAAA
jgi:nucleotide-binding universal stress UspA family protein